MQAASSITPEQQTLLKNLLEKVRTLHSLEAKNGWQFQEEKDGITIYTKLDKDTGMKIVRGAGPIAASIDAIEDVILNDIEASLEFDKTKDSGKLVEKLDNYYYYYSKTKSQFMVSSRDVCLVSTVSREPDGSVIIYGTSTTHPKVPEVKGNVRAHVHMWVWILVPTSDPNKVDVVYILESDAKGSVPTSLANMFAKDQALSVAELRKWFERKNKK